MAELSRAALFGKLSPIAYCAIESGATFGRLRGHARIELAHWLHQVLQANDSDLHRIVSSIEIDIDVLVRESSAALARLPSGDGRHVDLSCDVLEAAERGWLYASLAYGSQQVRTGHLLVGILETPALRRTLLAAMPSLARMDASVCRRALEAIAVESPEAAVEPEAHTRRSIGVGPSAADSMSDALARYTIDLTALARAGKLDPIVGRQAEIRQVIDILLRRRQNNPLLTGDAGVGKTAVVEGLAQRIAADNVPPSLRDVSVRVLDLGLLQAGAAAKGEFEARLRAVIEEVQSAQPPVILFIDEAHALIGAGGAAGTGDAANLLKPALARGTLRTIAATTWTEYKRYFEKDPALARRFQPVSIGEPDEAHALAMLRAIAPAMEAHHGVQVDDEALRAAVALSQRYINDRQLPDKAVSLLDTACARVAASRAAAPPALDHARERIATLAAEHALLAREHALGRCASARLDEARRALAAEREQAGLLEARWRDEARRVDALLCARAALCEAEPDDELASAEREVSFAGNDDRRAELARLERDLRERQGETAFVAASVDRESIAAVVQDWTGIPVRRMLRDEVEGVLALAERLDVSLIGQSHATRRIARRVCTARAGLQRRERPLGVFLLAGPSGVGKTETARALADALYGGERNLITFNMSEFQESHAISTLKGAPPGYVGYGEGGVLTEAVRRKPYCVVLLDEIDQAHHDVHSLFYQVFDKGWMEDGQGRMVDFRSTVILLTTNRGDDAIARAWDEAGGDDRAALDALRAPLGEALHAVFPAALLARMIVIPYLPLSDRSMREIVRAQLERVRERVATEHRVVLDYDEAVVSAILDRCAPEDGGGGARLVDAVVADALLPELGYALLEQRGEQAAIERIVLRIDDGAFLCRVER